MTATQDHGFSFAVMSHARKEPYFVSLWARYYGAIFGAGHLYLMKDGDDWDLPGTARIGTVRSVRFDGNRKKADEDFARASSDWATELLGRYDVVLRTDIDEFVCVDPKSGNWHSLAMECMEAGYLYAIGLDVIQNRRVEGPLDPHASILSQRRHAKITGAYCKPHAISRPVTWTSACHGVAESPVRLSRQMFMFHLASMDEDILDERMRQRGHTQERSYAGHLRKRRSEFDFMEKAVVTPFDAAEAELRGKIEFDPEGNRKSSPLIGSIMGQRSLKVLIPDRFSAVI